jgi:hypothetical protein
MSQITNLFNNDENDEFALTGEPISYPHDQNTRLNISNYGSNQGFMKIYQNSDYDKKVTVNGKLEINGDLIVYGDLNVSGKIISIQNNIKKLGNFMALTREIPEDVIKIMLLYIKSIDEKTYIECLDSLIYQPHIRLFSEDFILEYIDDVLKNHVGLLKLDNFYEKYLDNMPRLKLLLKLGGDE